MSALITADRVAALKPCADYSAEKLRSLLPQGRNVAGCLGLLLSLPPRDARWVLSRLLSAQGRIAWANGCAQRARRYAAARASATDAAAAAADAAAVADSAAAVAADAAAAAAYAAYAADDAAAAAESAAYYAAAATDAAARAAYYAAAETKLQCVLGLELLAAGFIND